jgi:hypothetical protein
MSSNKTRTNFFFDTIRPKLKKRFVKNKCQNTNKSMYFISGKIVPFLPSYIPYGSIDADAVGFIVVWHLIL